MKAKKLLLATLTVMCAMTTTVFTAYSSSDDEDHPYTYKYEVKMDPSSVGYSSEMQTVLAAFNQAVGANSSYLKSPQDNEMKAKCEAVKQQYANIESAYLKLYLIRITAQVGAADKVDAIATYEWGQAFITPYVEYAFVTNEDEAYAALETKKASLSDEVYKASYKTIYRLVGKHKGTAGAESVFEHHFQNSLGLFWPDTDTNTNIITHACDSIANAHAADTLAVDVTVAVTKTGLLNQQVTKFWEKKFSANFQ